MFLLLDLHFMPCSCDLAAQRIIGFFLNYPQLIEVRKWNILDEMFM